MSRRRFWIKKLDAAAILLPLVLSLAPASGRTLTDKLPAGHADVQASVAVPALPSAVDVHAASELLMKAGLVIGNVRCDPGSAAPGVVTRFFPASGTMLARGSAVDVYVSGRCSLQPRHFDPLARHSHVIYRGTITAHPPAPPPPSLPPLGSSSPPPAIQRCADGSLTIASGQCPAAAHPRVTAVKEPSARAASSNGSAPAVLTSSPSAPPPSLAPAPDAKPGVGGFVAPGDMEVENWSEVQFAVAADAVQLQVQVEGQQLAGQKAIYVAPVMRVTLLPNPDFDVQAKTSAVQSIGNDYASTWLWSVRPHKGGNEMLDAFVEVGRLNGKEFIPADSYTRHVPIRVNVGSWRGFLNALQNAATLGEALSTLFKSWGKTLIALTALIGAVGGLSVAIRKRSKSGGKREKEG